MIPWVRGKFAERRSRWLAARKQSNTAPSSAAVVAAGIDDDAASTTSSSSSMPSSPAHRRGAAGSINNTDTNASAYDEQQQAASSSTTTSRSPHDETPPTSSSLSSPTSYRRQQHASSNTSSSLFQHPMLRMSAVGNASPSLLSSSCTTASTTPKLLPSDSLLRIDVYGPRGQHATLALPADLFGHRLKIECMYLFGELGGNPAQYRLLLVAAGGGREVHDHQTLQEAALRSNDEVYLLCTADPTTVGVPLVGHHHYHHQQPTTSSVTINGHHRPQSAAVYTNTTNTVTTTATISTTTITVTSTSNNSHDVDNGDDDEDDVVVSTTIASSDSNNASTQPANARINHHQHHQQQHHQQLLQLLHMRRCERAPSQAEIDHVTSGLPSSHPETAGRSLPVVNIEELVLQSDVQYDIRQILVSLSVDAAHIIGMGAHARHLIDMFQMKLALAMAPLPAQTTPTSSSSTTASTSSSSSAIQQLIRMGFDADEATAVLQANGGSFSAALRLLIDPPLSMDEGGVDVLEDSPPLTDIADDATTPTTTPPTTPLLPLLSHHRRRLGHVAALLTIIRIYCRKDLAPPDDMVRLIREMGFAEPDVIEALKITKNNYAAACDWLIAMASSSASANSSSSANNGGTGSSSSAVGGSSGYHQRGKAKNRMANNATADTSSSGNRRTDAIISLLAEDGLPADSPILRALLCSPTVQASLSKPKMFIAYLSILEDYTTMSVWLGDAETAGTIGHILRTYHEEKHILAINQFATAAASSFCQH